MVVHGILVCLASLDVQQALCTVIGARFFDMFRFSGRAEGLLHGQPSVLFLWTCRRHAAETLRDLSSKYPAVDGNIVHFKFKGRGQRETPVTLTGPRPTGGVNFYTYIGSTLFKWQLLKLYIYWVHRGGIMYPTLEMAKTCLKRSLFED